MTPPPDRSGALTPSLRTGLSRRSARAAVLLAGALTVLGAILDPRRFAFSYLTAYAAVLGIVLGALSLLMIARVTGARWFHPLLPLARATAATLPLLTVLFLPVVAGLHALYPWVPPLGPMSDALRERILAKSAYLNVPFFLVRAAAYFVVWIGLAELLVRRPAQRGVWSAVGLPPFAFATTFAAIDWIMSLLPAWWSTIFGLYFWSGGFLAALAVTALLGDVAGLAGSPTAAPSARANTLGKLLLTFVLFWLYVGFSQLLVIWIGDVPLEASWLRPRLVGSWGVLGLVLLVGQFALPFALLLPRRNRERPVVLARIAAGLLIMHWVDAYWLVMPALTPGGVAPHWLDLTCPVAVAGVCAAFGSWRLRRLAPELPPQGAEALAFW